MMNIFLKRQAEMTRVPDSGHPALFFSLSSHRNPLLCHFSLVAVYIGSVVYFLLEKKDAIHISIWGNKHNPVGVSECELALCMLLRGTHRWKVEAPLQFNLPISNDFTSSHA